MKAHGQRLDLDALHATRGVARDNRIRRDEAPDARVVIARIIVQQVATERGAELRSATPLDLAGVKDRADVDREPAQQHRRERHLPPKHSMLTVGISL